MSWNYILAISFEIYYRMRNPYTVNFGGRSRLYHIFSQVTGWTVGIILISSPHNNGSSMMQTCFVENHSKFELFVLFPICVHVPIIVFLSVHCGMNIRGVPHLKFLWVHIRVCLVFFLSWAPSLVSQGLTYSKFYLNVPEWFEIVRVI